MRSVENARTALDDGKVDTAIKMMKSTDALCSRVVAPPTVHGIALRVLADAYMEKAAGRTESGTVEASESGEDAAKDNGKEEAEEESDYVDCAKRTLKKALDICKVHDGKAGMPRFMVQDLAGRMGDLYAAQGEIFRQEGNYKEALRSLRLGIGKFEVLGANEFVGAILGACEDQGAGHLRRGQYVHQQMLLPGVFSTGPYQNSTCSPHGKQLQPFPELDP